MSYLRFAYHRLKSDNKLLIYLVAPCLVGLAAVHYCGVIDSAAHHAQEKMEAEAQVKARALRSMGIRVDNYPGPGGPSGAPQGGMRR